MRAYIKYKTIIRDNDSKEKMNSVENWYLCLIWVEYRRLFILF